ncbi:MAG: dihydrodipicolinate synthase family protein [Phycisphaerae bacterium]
MTITLQDSPDDQIPHWLTGVLPVLPTPFSSDDEVDVKEIGTLIAFAARSGVKTVVTPAFGSEFYKLDGAERQKVIETAVAHAAPLGLKVVVQCNHTTPRGAERLATDANRLGAAAVATALPRAFAASEGQLMNYARRVCDATSLPVIVQDWNPAGRCADGQFFIDLNRQCSNFRMAKLEEPSIGPIVRAIKVQSGGRVGVLCGWGGIYTVQLFAAGISGIMPGLALADIFVNIWDRLCAGDSNAAMNRFVKVAAYLAFSLQTFEQFHHAEKRLLVRRGALVSTHVRPVTIDLDSHGSAYLDLLIDHLMSDIAHRGTTL